MAMAVLSFLLFPPLSNHIKITREIVLDYITINIFVRRNRRWPPRSTRRPRGGQCNLLFFLPVVFRLYVQMFYERQS